MMPARDEKMEGPGNDVAADHASVDISYTCTALLPEKVASSYPPKM